LNGAATSAKQDTGNTSLASIDSKITAVNTEAVVVASGSITANAGTNLNTSALLTTAAHDAAFGTAGSADTQVRSIQGIASMTPVQVSQATASNLNMTEASAASILTAVQLIDDPVATDDTTTHTTGTTKVMGIGAVATPSDGSVNANDIGMPAMSVDRRLHSDATLQLADADISATNALPTKGVPSDIDINGSNANHADKYYTNSGAVTDGIIWSPAAGKRWHVLTLYINVSAAATVTLEDDLAGGDVARWKGELAANSGVVLTYDKEHPFCSTEDAADLIITTSAGNVYVQAVGYEV
jgi:hypothetical protein